MERGVVGETGLGLVVVVMVEMVKGWEVVMAVVVPALAVKAMPAIVMAVMVAVLAAMVMGE